MAIDTKDKRFNMLYVAMPANFGLLPDPDGSIDANDRAHLLHVYGGNALAPPGGFVVAWASRSNILLGGGIV